jgi:peptidoglycan hydrolase CwlO-like protein
VEGSENRQPWLLIAIAAIALALGVVSLLIAMDAKNASNDAASQAQLDQVSNELSNLVDKLGIAEASLTGEQSVLQGRANKAAKQSRNAVTNLSNRLDRLERQTAALNASAKQTVALSKEVGSLQGQIKTIDGEVAALNKRVTKLSRRVNGAGAANSGGQSAP